MSTDSPKTQLATSNDPVTEELKPEDQNTTMSPLRTVKDEITRGERQSQQTISANANQSTYCVCYKSSVSILASIREVSMR